MKFVRIEVRDMQHGEQKTERAFVMHLDEKRIPLLLDNLKGTALSMTGVQFEEISVAPAPFVKKTD